MYTLTKIESSIRPDMIESLNNGIYYFNSGITEEVVPTEEGEETRYRFNQVRIAGKPTVEKCYEILLKNYKNESGATLEAILNSPNKTSVENDLASEIYTNLEIAFGLREPISELDQAKNKKIKEIDEYDTSSEVNSFYLNGVQVWLDKATRVGLMNSLNIEKSAGKTNSTLWLGNVKIVVPIDSAVQMLNALELYALECYNKTAEHKKTVEGLTEVSAVSNYNYKEGYPAKLEFTIE